MTARRLSFLFIRCVTSIIYLWVVADRLGILGTAGNMGVVWGNFQNFLDYTAILNPWFPRMISDFLGYFVTCLEVILAFLLISGIRLKESSLASFALLIIFIISMTSSLGFNAAFGYIIFTSSIAITSALIYFEERLNEKN